MSSLGDPAAAPREAAPVVVRRLTLRPSFDAPRQARRLLRDLGQAVGQDGWLDNGELACTELVTNAVLHAHTSIEVVARATPDELLVEVRDRSPVLPTPRTYDSFATTGRGMAMVAALVTDFGIRDAGRGGKTTWFMVRADSGSHQDEADLLAAWGEADADDERDPTPATTAAQRADDTCPPERSAPAGPPQAPPARGRWVQLRGLPPTLWLAAGEHHNTILRELALYLAQVEVAGVDLAATDQARSCLSTAVRGALEHTRRDRDLDPDLPAGHPTPLEPFDLDLFVPTETAGCFTAMQDTLDVAERIAAAAELLASPALPEVVAIRDWACEQVIAQHAGAPAKPWPGTDHERFTADVDAAFDVSDWDLDAVRHSELPVVAADDSNRMVAVSPALARLVGWDPERLVGRRIVTLIPPRLREVHVAGFTRHLTTGVSHILGTPVRFPVLCSDGSEVVCRVVLESVAAPRGRRYLAHLSLAAPGDG